MNIPTTARTKPRSQCVVDFARSTLLIQHCSAEFADLLGYGDPTELAGQVLLDLIASSSFEAFDRLIRSPYDTPSAICAMKHVDGGEVLVGIAVLPTPPESQNGSVTILCIQIEDQRSQNAKLKREAQTLSAQNERLRDLSNLANHDLRNLLQTVLSGADLIKLHLNSGKVEQAAQMLTRIQSASADMASLIEAVEKYVRFEVGDYPMELTDISGIVDKIVEENRDAHGRPVLIQRVHDLPTIVCEAPLIRELFMNIVGNAIQYADKETIEIEIGLRNPPPASPVFYVKDNSAGISADDLPTIFDAFTRADRKGLNASGTGMGMTLVQKIVERHGGQVWLESTLGEGTTVMFSLDGNRSTEG